MNKTKTMLLAALLAAPLSVWGADLKNEGGAGTVPSAAWSVQRDKWKELREAEKAELKGVDADQTLAAAAAKRTAKKAIREKYRKQRQDLRAQFRAARRQAKAGALIPR